MWPTATVRGSSAGALLLIAGSEAFCPCQTVVHHKPEYNEFNDANIENLCINLKNPLPSQSWLFTLPTSLNTPLQKNEGGGEWRIVVPRRSGDHTWRRHVDEWFMHTCLGVIGETLDENQDVINGVVINIRKREDRICLWTRTSDPGKVLDVGRNLRKLLAHAKLEEKVPIRFQSFEDLYGGGASSKILAEA